jgi:hypothetical protein
MLRLKKDKKSRDKRRVQPKSQKIRTSIGRRTAKTRRYGKGVKKYASRR